MVGARASGVAKAGAVLGDESGAERLKPRVANRARGRDDEFPIRALTRANLGRALQKLQPFVIAQRTCAPSADIESILLMLVKFARDLGEIAALHRVAGLVIRMVAPDPQRHSIARV